MPLPSLAPLLARILIPLALASSASALANPQQPPPASPQQAALEAAVAKALQQQKAAEDARLDRMPDVFQCAQMTWLKPIECKELNRQAKLNPGAPVRAHTAEGVEIVFPPGVSSAEMMHVLSGTEESAIAYLQDMERLNRHQEKAAQNYRKALARWEGTRGVFNGFEEHMRERNPDIKEDQIIINVFYESTCPACEKYFSNVVDMKKKYPRMRIFLFQIDKDTRRLARVQKQTGLPARIMTPEELAQMKSQGLTRWPYTLVDNPQIKKRIAKYGVTSVSHLEAAAARLSVLADVAGASQ